MPDEPLTHVHDSRAFRQLEQLVEDFRAGRCGGFFFVGMYPTGVETAESRQVSIHANCLCPTDLAEFRETFLAALALFHRSASVEKRGVMSEKTCEDFDRYLTAGGTA